MPFGVEEITAIGVDGSHVADGIKVRLGVNVAVAVIVGCAVKVPSTACATRVAKCAVAVPLGVDEITMIGVDEGCVTEGVIVAVAVYVADGVTVGLGVKVDDGVRVDVGVKVAVASGV